MTEETNETPAIPPAQVVGVVGTDFTAVANAQKKLGRLPLHPPFQAFIESREPNEQGIDSARYAHERASAMAGNIDGGFDAVIAAYLAWWHGKGWWKGEDPLGGTTPEAPSS